MIVVHVGFGGVQYHLICFIVPALLARSPAHMISNSYQIHSHKSSESLTDLVYVRNATPKCRAGTPYPTKHLADPRNSLTKVGAVFRSDMDARDLNSQIKTRPWSIWQGCFSVVNDVCRY